MKSSLQPGLSAESRFTVDRERTIDFMGEAARVYATPMLVRDIEIACRDLLGKHLDAGEDSVGTRVEVEGRDAVEKVVRGKHSRFVVDVAKTAQRLAAKAEKARASS